MSESYSGHSQWSEYERLLNEMYDDVPDDWDMYEDTGVLRRAFAQGKTAAQVLGLDPDNMPPRHTFDPPDPVERHDESKHGN